MVGFQARMNVSKAKYVIIGGGIAGVTCAETLSWLCPEETIILLSASSLVKAVTNFNQITKTLEVFDVEEKSFAEIETVNKNIVILHKEVVSLDSVEQNIKTADGSEISYEKLCICTGGKPKVIADSPYVLGIRDTESVQTFQEKLSSARRVIIIGNGGIATELVYEIEGCSVIWAIKDKSISSTFVDAGAGEFFLKKLNKKKEQKKPILKRMKYNINATDKTSRSVVGGALGPDWSSDLVMSGIQTISHNVHVEFQVEVEKILSSDEFKQSGKQETCSPFEDKDSATTTDWPIYVLLANGKVYGCDFVVSATGVVPNTELLLQGNSFDRSEDGGIKVNSKMLTSVPNVFAAGDVCSPSWKLSEHWFQMRLWTQARQMGAYAAKSMVASDNQEDIEMDFCFELFSHVTKFFNSKVILLGKFNAQGLGNDYELLLRVTEDEEYLKVVLSNNRMQGAILIGETDMEETFENLILNQMDLTCFKENLLEPGIDVDDFFD
ncbi:nucleotide-disulfide oxidoreductase domain-containing 1-like [Octopus vulgaris]|uniref:Pyridine nucleotide-disulfide oxidoreductase domain-containing protein 1 n=1 Tax=Octopus vulgaris TaxID=6645 RepID=A0AA36BM12_OCTVU|nr:nucleotide-disulfide oxidoreductase domain-containing 1-like [Octopus vulgaris]